MANEEHLHEETQMLMVKNHNYMITKQYHLGMYHLNHPYNALLNQEQAPTHVLDSADSLVY